VAAFYLKDLCLCDNVGHPVGPDGNLLAGHGVEGNHHGPVCHGFFLSDRLLFASHVVRVVGGLFCHLAFLLPARIPVHAGRRNGVVRHKASRFFDHTTERCTNLRPHKMVDVVEYKSLQ
jgi:hypothetical protein